MTQTEQPAATPAAGDSCTGQCGGVARVSRRTAISAGFVSGAAVLVGCSSDPDPAAAGPTTTSATSASSTGSSTSTPDTALSSATETTASAVPASDPPTIESTSSAADPSSAPEPSTAVPPTGTEIAKLADVPAGGSLVVVDGDNKVALAKGDDGSVVAHTAVCTHNGCTVNAAGPILHCPCHGSEFDAFTGAVVQSPAQSALAARAVTVFGDAVYLS